MNLCAWPTCQRSSCLWLNGHGSSQFRAQWKKSFVYMIR